MRSSREKPSFAGVFVLLGKTAPRHATGHNIPSANPAFRTERGARPPRACPPPRPLPYPGPPSASPPAPAAAETLVLHTRLLGDLRVPGTAGQTADGLRVLVRRSRTDQRGAG